jgi:hypothetical protein
LPFFRPLRPRRGHPHSKFWKVVEQKLFLISVRNFLDFSFLNFLSLKFSHSKTLQPTMEDVFDEIVKFSDQMSWKGGQKMNRKTSYEQKRLFNNFLKFWFLLKFSEKNMNSKILLMASKLNNKAINAASSKNISQKFYHQLRTRALIHILFASFVCDIWHYFHEKKCDRSVFFCCSVCFLGFDLV